MIPERNPYNNWKGNGSTKTFDFDFLIEDETQLVVYHTNSSGVQTVLTYGTDYSINELGNENGSFITFPLDGSSYETLGSDEVISLCLTLPITQENPFGKSSFLDLETLEYVFDYIIRICQIMNRELERSVKILEGSDIDTDKLTQDLMIVSDNINSINTNATNISDINTVADNVTDINTVAGSITNVNTVAENINAIIAVDDNKTNINAVNSNKTNINTVAGSINNVNTVAGSISNVNTTATNITNINTAATNISSINTTAADILDVITVSDNIDDVNTTATNISDVNTVADNITDVKTAAGSISNVNTVADNIAAHNGA